MFDHMLSIVLGVKHKSFNNKQMKSTKLMLAVIATLLITWTLMSLIGYALSDASLRECYTHGGTLMLMLVFGWIPSAIVGYDLNDKLKNY